MLIADRKARELERRLCQYLGMPGGWGPDTSRPIRISGAELAGLWQAVRDLELACDQIGKVPVGYPWYLNVVMKVIAALLPWYTRPLVEFARQTTEAVRRITEILPDTGSGRVELSVNSRRVDPLGSKEDCQ